MYVWFLAKRPIRNDYSAPAELSGGLSPPSLHTGSRGVFEVHGFWFVALLQTLFRWAYCFTSRECLYIPLFNFWPACVEPSAGVEPAPSVLQTDTPPQSLPGLLDGFQHHHALLCRRIRTITRRRRQLYRWDLLHTPGYHPGDIYSFSRSTYSWPTGW